MIYIKEEEYVDNIEVYKICSIIVTELALYPTPPKE